MGEGQLPLFLKSYITCAPEFSPLSLGEGPGGEDDVAFIQYYTKNLSQFCTK